MVMSGFLKKFAWMPLAVAPLLGCFFFDDPKEDSSSWIAGFASDTTAIIFSYNWETTKEYICAFEHACGRSAPDYLDIELKLVDVRFKKTYWKSKVKNNYGRDFRIKQWNDSTIFLEGRGYWLWAIGNSKPQQITLNWNNTDELKRKIFGRDYNWLHLKNDSIFVYNVDESIIIDTKANIVNNWFSPDGYKWIIAYKDDKDNILLNKKMLWWGEVAGGGVLVS